MDKSGKLVKSRYIMVAKAEGKKFMKMDEILSTIEELSYHQGFYGRLLRDIIELKNNDEDGYNDLKKELENQNFKTTLDMVLYFEQ